MASRKQTGKLEPAIAVQPGDVPDDGIVMEEAPAAAATAPRAGETYIKYVGPYTNRVIRAEDWKSVGIDNAPTVAWTPQNVWTINANLLPAKAVDWCRDQEPELLLLETGDARLGPNPQETLG
jgi:hypothetical protein